MNRRAIPRTGSREFGRAELPVLARTVAELERIARDVDRVSTQHVADIVMHDPLMTFKVLRYIQQRRRKQPARRRDHDRALADDARHEPVPRAFRGAGDARSRGSRPIPTALQGALAVISRARHAALYARDWAVLRHDIEIDEVTTAALLHDLAELLLWCCAPQLAMQIQDAPARATTCAAKPRSAKCSASR